MRLMDAYIRSYYQERLRDILHLGIAIPDKHGRLYRMTLKPSMAGKIISELFDIGSRIYILADFYNDYVGFMQ